MAQVHKTSFVETRLTFRRSWVKEARHSKTKKRKCATSIGESGSDSFIGGDHDGRRYGCESARAHGFLVRSSRRVEQTIARFWVAIEVGVHGSIRGEGTHEGREGTTLFAHTAFGPDGRRG